MRPAFAFVAVRAGLTDLRRSQLDERVAHLFDGVVDAFDMGDLVAHALPAKERRARGPAAWLRREAIERDELRPVGDEVRLVGDAHERHDLNARWSDPDLVDE